MTDQPVEGVHELFAIRYATRDARRAEHFIGGDPHEGQMPMDYFVWVVRSADRLTLIDTGCTRPVAEARGRTYLRCPVESLDALGFEADDVSDVIVTHLHYDHAGNFNRFPNARFHIQARELSYATGPHMRHEFLSRAFEVDDVADLVRLNFKGRIVFHEGDSALWPGLTLHLAGGHSHGLQYVRVQTRRGWVVVASDVAHYYENITSRRPFTIAYHVGEMLDGLERMMMPENGLNRVIPGHDPAITALYPAISQDQAHILRLDVEPDADGLARIEAGRFGYRSGSESRQWVRK